MRVLSLDLSSTATGWAIHVYHEAGEPSWSTASAAFGNGFELEGFGVIRPTCPPGLERLVEIGTAVRSLATEIDAVVAEDYGFAAKGSSQQLLGELRGVVGYMLREQSLAIRYIGVGSWKKAVLGKGNLHKDEIKLQMFKQYGIEAPQDALDAIGVGMAAWMISKGLDKPPKKPRQPAKKIMESF